MLKKVIFILFFAGAINAMTLSERLDEASLNPLVAGLFKPLVADINDQLTEKCLLKSFCQQILTNATNTQADLKRLKTLLNLYLNGMKTKNRKLLKLQEELLLILW